MSLSKCSLHFWHKGPVPERFCGIDFMAVQDVIPAQPWLFNGAASFPRLLEEEMIYENEVSDIRQRRMVPSEQKRAQFMDVGHTYSQVGDQ